MFFLAAVCQQEFQPSLIFQNQSMPAEKFIGVPLFHPPMNSHLVLLLVQTPLPPSTGGLDGEAEDGGHF